MQNFYQVLTVEDGRKDEASIIEALSAVKHGRLANDIKLLNYYKGLPINFPATIVSANAGVVEMAVHELQAASMLLQKETFIKSDHLPHAVNAHILKVKKEDNLVLLNNVKYADIPSERRICVRVKVPDRVDAAFHSSAQLVRGTIEDISFGGVAIKAPKGSILEENVKGMVSIWLPDAKLELSGNLLRVHEDDSLKKYVFELEIDNKNERLISQFIFMQQSKIIRELKDIRTMASYG